MIVELLENVGGRLDRARVDKYHRKEKYYWETIYEEIYTSKYEAVKRRRLLCDCFSDKLAFRLYYDKAAKQPFSASLADITKKLMEPIEDDADVI